MGVGVVVELAGLRTLGKSLVLVGFVCRRVGADLAKFSGQLVTRAHHDALQLVAGAGFEPATSWL